MKWVWIVFIVWALYLLGDTINRYRTADVTTVKTLNVGVPNE